MQARVQELEAELAENKAIIARLQSKQETATGHTIAPSAILAVPCTKNSQIDYFPWQVCAHKVLTCFYLASTLLWTAFADLYASDVMHGWLILNATYALNVNSLQR